ncbi:hypothetical protein HY732_05105 [Candidatus Uhrbacteria bacterium]|nr:hypothetical protein [Candidatus Uhrbacteria bacterium]
MDMKKIVLSVLAAAVIAGGGSFWGGMQYAESKSIRARTGSSMQDFRALSSEERAQRGSQFAGQNGPAGRGGRQGGGGGPITGDILSRDEASITVKLPDGGSKIVFFSDTTEIGEFVAGTKDDLETGRTIGITGKANTDGSVTAQSIQVRPSRSNKPMNADKTK